MAEVTWFKVLTDIFSDDKIKILQSMPEGDSLLVMWFKVLSQAGKTNDGGYIYLKSNIPYTAGMLATLFGKPQQIVELALRTFTEFGMIDIDERGFIFVMNWEKHQSIEGMERVREKTRMRVNAHREKKRLELMQCNVTSNATVTVGNATDIEVDKELKETTTTTRDEPQMTVMDAHQKAFGTLSMNSLVSEYTMNLRKKGYTDSFLIELFLEIAESSAKPSFRYLQEVGDRWQRDKIYSRAQAKADRSKVTPINTKYNQPKREEPKYGVVEIPQEELERMPRG